MDVIESISQIDNHKYQNVITNDFKQGSKYVKTDFNNKNNYVKIPRINSKEKIKNVVRYTTVFDKIVCNFDNMLNIDNITDYRNKFFDLIAEDVYKSVSRRHNILKKDLFAFVHENEYVMPKNNEVIMLLSTIIKCNVIIVLNKSYNKYEIKTNDKTLVIERDGNGKIYDDILIAEMELISNNIHHNVDFTNMKLTEIKDYIKKNNITIDQDIKKKSDIIQYLENLKINK